MVAKILVNEKNTLEMDIGSADQSLAQLLAERLTEDKDVEFASYKVEHPFMTTPKLIVRTKKGDPAKLVLEKLDELKKELGEFRKQFSEISE
ncbi:MAG: RpoL/Rpb11 RNA polymerase subunit family protein [Candidatus ainarchaeum sp.]|nr:RpoL/Rpb11 RNA polymerase subunit family protein [Candidatus ainarchaeum sp.]